MVKGRRDETQCLEPAGEYVVQASNREVSRLGAGIAANYSRAMSALATGLWWCPAAIISFKTVAADGGSAVDTTLTWAWHLSGPTFGSSMMGILRDPAMRKNSGTVWGTDRGGRPWRRTSIVSFVIDDSKMRSGYDEGSGN